MLETCDGEADLRVERIKDPYFVVSDRALKFEYTVRTTMPVLPSKSVDAIMVTLSCYLTAILASSKITT